jgi:tetratricopeptide (TPR) repeat protein
LLAGCASLDIGKPGETDALARAQELRRAGNSDQAAAVAQRALLTVAPGDVKLQGELARDLVETNPSRALDILADCMDPAEPDPKLYIVAGAALTVLGKFKDAEHSFAEAAKLAPDDPGLKENQAIEQRMAAAAEPSKVAALDANGSPAKLKTGAATSHPRTAVKRASEAPIEPKITAKVLSVPEVPAVPFADRWHIL